MNVRDTSEYSANPDRHSTRQSTNQRSTAAIWCEKERCADAIAPSSGSSSNDSTNTPTCNEGQFDTCSFSNFGSGSTLKKRQETVRSEPN